MEGIKSLFNKIFNFFKNLFSSNESSETKTAKEIEKKVEKMKELLKSNKLSALYKDPELKEVMVNERLICTLTEKLTSKVQLNV